MTGSFKLSTRKAVEIIHLRMVRGERIAVTCLAVLPTGHVISGGTDGALHLWDVDSGVELALIAGQGFGFEPGITCLDVLPNGCVIAGKADGSVSLWSAKIDGSLEYKYGFDVHKDAVTCLSFFSNEFAVTGGADHTLRYWNGVTGEVLSTLHLDAVPLALSFDRDAIIYVGDQTGCLHQIGILGLTPRDLWSYARESRPKRERLV